MKDMCNIMFSDPDELWGCYNGCIQEEGCTDDQSDKDCEPKVICNREKFGIPIDYDYCNLEA